MLTMLVAIHLTPTLKLRGREDDHEEDGDGHGIWSAPCLLPSPWQSLPSDLLFHSVLVCLPFSVLLKLRSVSCSWRERLSSHNFWLLWFQGISNPNPVQDVLITPNLVQDPSPNPCFQLAEDLYPYHVFDNIISNCGANLSNCSLPCLLLCSAQSKASPACHVARGLCQAPSGYLQQQDGAAIYRIPEYWSWLHESFMQVREPYTLLASDGGLLLLVTCSKGCQTLTVCNPLLRGHKVICNPFGSPLTDMSVMAVGFIVDKEHGEYRVFLIRGGCQVYSSSTGKWQMIPTELFKDSASVATSNMDSSYSWLSHQQVSFSPYGESILFAYHADANVVTSASSRFPLRVSLPNPGRVWKDSYGLHTVAWSQTWCGIWKLDNGLWKCEKVLLLNAKLSNLADYVKVDNLLLLRFSKSNKLYVFDFGLDRGCWTPYCDDAKYLTGHCVFRPSCVQV